MIGEFVAGTPAIRKVPGAQTGPLKALRAISATERVPGNCHILSRYERNSTRRIRRSGANFDVRSPCSWFSRRFSPHDCRSAGPLRRRDVGVQQPSPGHSQGQARLRAAYGMGRSPSLVSGPVQQRRLGLVRVRRWTDHDESPCWCGYTGQAGHEGQGLLSRRLLRQDL